MIEKNFYALRGTIQIEANESSVFNARRNFTTLKYVYFFHFQLTLIFFSEKINLEILQ